jgi:hypothetical protein
MKNRNSGTQLFDEASKMRDRIWELPFTFMITITARKNVKSSAPYIAAAIRN